VYSAVRHNEIIKHLLFYCKFATSIWPVIQLVPIFYSQRCVANIFGRWLHGVDHTLAIAVIWLFCTNFSLMQVTGAQRVENQDLFLELSIWLEDTTSDIFT
jgi:hypothetical protein